MKAMTLNQWISENNAICTNKMDKRCGELIYKNSFRVIKVLKKFSNTPINKNSFLNPVE